METVEVVIRLPQNLYLDVKNGHASNIQRERVIELVKNSTVLPEGHGRLVDADAILEDPYGNTYKDIDIAETIIEADKEGEVNESNTSKV